MNDERRSLREGELAELIGKTAEATISKPDGYLVMVTISPGEGDMSQYNILTNCPGPGQAYTLLQAAINIIRRDLSDVPESAGGDNEEDIADGDAKPLPN